jgi:hypothetical protein
MSSTQILRNDNKRWNSLPEFSLDDPATAEAEREGAPRGPEVAPTPPAPQIDTPEGAPRGPEVAPTPPAPQIDTPEGVIRRLSYGRHTVRA